MTRGLCNPHVVPSLVKREGAESRRHRLAEEGGLADGTPHVQDATEKKAAEHARMALRLGICKMLDAAQKRREADPARGAALLGELNNLKQVGAPSFSPGMPSWSCAMCAESQTGSECLGRGVQSGRLCGQCGEGCTCAVLCR